MQKQKGAGDDPWGSAQDGEQVKIKVPDFKLPDVHESMRLAGAKDLVLSPTDSQGRAQRRQRLLCCCGMRGCGIGPMTQTYEEDGS